MKDEIINILSENLDENIVEDLIESYVSVKKSYINSDYEETQSKSGKFVENVFRLLHYIRTGKVILEMKKMNDESDKLLKLDSSKFSDTIRIIIPEIAKTLVYLPRSKMGSVHVKEISPDYIDAKLTVEACNWIIAELLRIYHKRDTQSIENLIKNVVQEDIPILQKHEEEVFLNVKTKADEEILIRLFDANEGLTREEIGSQMKQNFSPATITLAIKKLIQGRKIHLTKQKKYILADTQRKKVSSLIESLTDNYEK